MYDCVELQQMLATTAEKNLEDLRKTLPAPPQGTSSHEPAPASSPVRAVHEKPQQAMYDQGDWAATAAPETAADGKDSTESSFKPAAAAPVIDIRSAPSRREADSDPPHKQGDVDRESKILVVSATPTTPTHYDASSPSNKLPNAAITDRVPTGPAMVPPHPEPSLSTTTQQQQTSNATMTGASGICKDNTPTDRADSRATPQTLTAQERVLQAAIERLAVEDAQEELDQQAMATQAYDKAGVPDKAGVATSVSDREVEQQVLPCPAGFQCSDFGPISADGAVSELGEREGVPQQRYTSTDAGGEEVMESMQLAYTAAKQRAEALKVGRHMLTAEGKARAVAIRHEEVERAASAPQAHPMYRRAVAAAAATLDQLVPTEPRQEEKKTGGEMEHGRWEQHAPVAEMLTGAQPAQDGDEKSAMVSAKHTADLSGGAERRVLDAHEKAEVTGRIGPDQSSSSAPQQAAVAPQPHVSCGLGLGIKAAGEGMWKVSAVKAGGPLARANDSGATHVLQVGHILVSVNGRPLAGISRKEVSTLVKGHHGEKVELEFRAVGDATLHSISVERDCMAGDESEAARLSSQNDKAGIAAFAPADENSPAGMPQSRGTRSVGGKECGLGLAIKPAAQGAWQVSSLKATGSLARANDSGATHVLQVGHILVSVNGRPLAGMSGKEVSTLVKGHHGEKVELEFRAVGDATLHSISVERHCE